MQADELIISNNNSSDNTENSCKQYLKKDSRIKYFKQKKNLGFAKNFEFVLRKAKGKYFMLSAHDDLYKKTHIHDLLKIHKTNNKIAVAMSDTIHIDKKQKKIGAVTYDHSLFNKKNKNKLLKSISLQSKLTYFIYGLWKRPLIIKLLPYHLNFKFYDKFFIIKAALKYQFGYNPKATFYKRKFNINPGLKYLESDHNLQRLYSSDFFSFSSIFYFIKELFLVKLKKNNFILKTKICFFYSCWILSSIFYSLVYKINFKLK